MDSYLSVDVLELTRLSSYLWQEIILHKLGSNTSQFFNDAKRS